MNWAPSVSKGRKISSTTVLELKVRRRKDPGCPPATFQFLLGLPPFGLPMMDAYRGSLMPVWMLSSKTGTCVFRDFVGAHPSSSTRMVASLSASSRSLPHRFSGRGK